MFIILAYDVQVKRNRKVKKIVRRYLRPRQKSVCEGFLTEAKLRQMKEELAQVIQPEQDAILIYKMDSAAFLKTDEIGYSTQRDPRFL